jgi:hypothetical protein
MNNERKGVRVWGRLCLALAVMGTSAAAWGQQVEVVNNQPFPIRMPWRVHPDGNMKGDGTTILVDVAAKGRQTIDVSAAGEPKAAKALSVDAVEDGLKLTFAGDEVGTLTFGVVVRPAVAGAGKEDTAGAGKPELSFKPLALAFRKGKEERHYTTYTAETTDSGLQIRISADVYPSGFADLRTTVTNESAPQKGVFAAVTMRWAARSAGPVVAGYDNRTIELGANANTPWRAGEGRHLFVQRGLDWAVGRFQGGASALLLNDFAPSFTYHKAKTAKAAAQWIGANGPQLTQEAYTDDAAFYCVTELAHPNIRSYRGRVQDNILPDKSQPMAFAQRLVFSKDDISAEAADQAFVGYTSFNSERPAGKGIELSFGVPHSRFGTAYFPYSTLGENFITRRLPGMSQDTYWALAADTVKQYTLFADEIRRDLRIAKAMGFESIRLHHLEMLYTTDAKAAEYVSPEQRWAYLDFFFGELKHLGLTALLDVKLAPEQVAELCTRYKGLVDGVEIDNEVLIFGVKDEDVETWKGTYAAVKQVDPGMPVHLTGHTNTGVFDRLDQLGVPYDKVGSHAYMDSLDAIPSSRNYSLQVSSLASKKNKPPTITEWNWRFLTRMTEEARAAVYAPIFENVLKARSMPLIYQFQFIDSLAMNPIGLRGIRHYELINLSRRPKEEAAVFQRLIDTYSAPDSTTRTVKLERQVVELKDGAGQATFDVANTSGGPLKLTATAEAFGGGNVTVGADAGAAGPLSLAAGQSAKLPVSVSVPADAAPGFYHTFVRLQDKDAKVLRYAWIEARKPGQPKFDKESKSDVVYGDGALDFDFDRPVAVVYGDDCPGDEVEAAWLIHQTLEAATGRRVNIYTLSDVPKGYKGAAIYVGTAKSLPVIGQAKATDGKFVGRGAQNGVDALLVGGSDTANCTKAAMDFALRYWTFAKDSACRRVPLVPNTTFKGPDAGQLP